MRIRKLWSTTWETYGWDAFRVLAEVNLNYRRHLNDAVVESYEGGTNFCISVTSLPMEFGIRFPVIPRNCMTIEELSCGFVALSLIADHAVGDFVNMSN